jgi:hypothetical protein
VFFIYNIIKHKKCCFTHIEPDPPVRASSLLLSLSFSIEQLHRHGPNSQGNKSWQLVGKNSIFSLAHYIWRALLGMHLLRTITLLVHLYFLSIFLYCLLVLGYRGNSGLWLCTYIQCTCPKRSNWDYNRTLHKRRLLLLQKTKP